MFIEPATGKVATYSASKTQKGKKTTLFEEYQDTASMTSGGSSGQAEFGGQGNFLFNFVKDAMASAQQTFASRGASGKPIVNSQAPISCALMPTIDMLESKQREHSKVTSKDGLRRLFCDLVKALNPLMQAAGDVPAAAEGWTLLKDGMAALGWDMDTNAESTKVEFPCQRQDVEQVATYQFETTASNEASENWLIRC
eukprot:SAG25_NODE_175_length_12811_cov_5.011721_2_plen_198_part_00